MKIASLFSGAGGLDLGFAKAGHHIVWANDLFVDAVETYKNNIGEHIVCADISAIDVLDIPDCDMIIGGFPCQGFSVANIKRSVSDKRNALYGQLVRVIEAKKPKFFLAENVKGLLNLAKGAVLNVILSDFSRIGYKVKYRLLNAANFGVPQIRERVIIVGIREDLDYEYIFPQETHSRKPEAGKRSWLSVGEALSAVPNPDLPNEIPNHEYSKYKLRFNGYIGHRTIDPKKPAPTVTARGDDRGGVVVLHHPNNTRRMTCRELAIVQSFPLDYVFSGTRSSIYRQIGNAVPPQMAYAIAKKFPVEE